MTMIRIFKSVLLLISTFALISCIHQQNTPQRISPSQEAARENAHLVFNYLHRGYTDKAHEKLEIALQQAPRDPVILDTAGYYYEKIGILKIANRFYKQAVISAPYSGIAKNNYGAFLCRNGYYKESLPLFKQAAATPNTPITRLALKNEQYCGLQLQSRLGESPTYAYDTHLRME